MSSSTAVRAEPNVTPMIDVMLVLLIIFMAVGPLLAAGFRATPPRGQNLAAHPDEEHDTVVGLDARGTLYLDKVAVTEPTLRARLAARFRGHATDRLVYLRADKDLSYERVQATMAIVAEAGATVVGLVSEQQAATPRPLSTP